MNPWETIENTSNLIDAQLGKEPSSVHADQLGDPLTEPSLRHTVPPTPLDPHNEASLEVAMESEWSDGRNSFLKQFGLVLSP